MIASVPSAASRSARWVGWVAVLLGTLAVGLVMITQQPGTPPLYNGLGFPDEPYRWVQAPAGATPTDPWTPATANLRYENGKTSSALVASRELGPQVSFFLDEGAFAAPGGATGVNVRADAVPPPSVPPPGGTLVSNLYRFSAAAAGADGPVTFAAGKRSLINLRAAKATDAYVLLHRWHDGRWEQLATFQVGTDIYAGTIGELGDYALVKMNSKADVSVPASTPSPVPTGYTQGTASSRGGEGLGAPGTGPSVNQPLVVDPGAGVSNRRLWIGVGGAALVLALGLVLARIAATRGKTTDPAANSGDGTNPQP